MAITGQARIRRDAYKKEQELDALVAKRTRHKVYPIMLHTPLVDSTGNGMKVIIPVDGKMDNLRVHIGAITTKDGAKQCLLNIIHSIGAARDGYTTWINQGRTTHVSYDTKLTAGELLIFKFDQAPEDADILDVSISFNIVSGD